MEYVPSYTINKACGPSLKDISLVVQFIKAEDCEIVLAEWTESMSNIPYLLIETRWDYRLGGNALVDSQYKNVIFSP